MQEPEGRLLENRPINGNDLQDKQYKDYPQAPCNRHLPFEDAAYELANRSRFCAAGPDSDIMRTDA